MPPVSVWLAGLSVIPTSVYGFYQYVYVPRVTTQSESERVADASTRPWQLLESDLSMFGGAGCRLSAWTTPNGQRDVPYISNVHKKETIINNGNKYECDLPPYQQPSGVLPQTNAEKNALFAVIQYLRLALIVGCMEGTGSRAIIMSDPASERSGANRKWEELVKASILAQFSPKTSMKRQRGLLFYNRSSVGETEMSNSFQTCAVTSSKVSTNHIADFFSKMGDGNREDLLRRLAHIEVTKLFLSSTEGDLRYISASRIARHAQLPQTYDIVILPKEWDEAAIAGHEGKTSNKNAPQRKERFIARREDGLFLPKPLHFWIRPKAIDSEQKSGTITTVDLSLKGDEYEDEFSHFGNKNNGNNTVQLPNGKISVGRFSNKLGIAISHEGDDFHRIQSIVSQLRQTGGFSRMLVSPYLRFRDTVMSRKEQYKSAFAFVIYKLVFKSVIDSEKPCMTARAVRGQQLPAATNISSYIAEIVHQRFSGQNNVMSCQTEASLVNSTVSAILFRGGAFFAYHILSLFGPGSIISERGTYSNEWLTDFKYHLAQWLVHSVLQIDTRLCLADDDGKVNVLATNGKMERGAEAPSQNLLLAISPSIWIEELGMYAAAGALARKNNNQKPAVKMLSIATFPATSFPHLFNRILRSKIESEAPDAARSKLRIGLPRSDLFPLTIAETEWLGFPCPPHLAKAWVGMRVKAAATGEVDGLLDGCEVTLRSVAISGTPSVVQLSANSPDPLLYAMPDQKVVSTGIDIENQIEKLQKRGMGSDENVFIADEKEREKFLRTSKLSSIGGKVGQGSNLKEQSKEQDSPKSNPSAFAKSIEHEIWMKNLITAGAFDSRLSAQLMFPVTFDALRYNQQQQRSVSITDAFQGELKKMTIIPRQIYGGIDRRRQQRRIEFCIGRPTVALPTLALSDGEQQRKDEVDVLLQFATVEYVGSLLATVHRFNQWKVGEDSSKSKVIESLQS